MTFFIFACFFNKSVVKYKYLNKISFNSINLFILINEKTLSI